MEWLWMLQLFINTLVLFGLAWLALSRRRPESTEGDRMNELESEWGKTRAEWSFYQERISAQLGLLKKIGDKAQGILQKGKSPLLGASPSEEEKEILALNQPAFSEKQPSKPSETSIPTLEQVMSAQKNMQPGTETHLRQILREQLS